MKVGNKYTGGAEPERSRRNNYRPNIVSVREHHEMRLFVILVSSSDDKEENKSSNKSMTFIKDIKKNKHYVHNKMT